MLRNKLVSIPQEIMPFFLVIFPASKDHIFITHVYNTLIVPYVQKLISKIQLTSLNEQQVLLLLKSMFTKKLSSMPVDEREKIMPLYIGLHSLEKFAFEFENAFFKAILQKNMDVTADFFLPSNFKKHLKTILKLQVLIMMRENLRTIQLEKNQELINYKQWVKREIEIRTVPLTDKKEISRQKADTYYPSMIWYFFNGAPRLWLFMQLEYLKIKKIILTWYDWLYYLNHETLSFKVVGISLPIAALKFLLDLLFVALMPYRFLRTSVNEISNYISMQIQDILHQYNHHSIRGNNWIIFNFVLQLGIYIGLTLSVGLPILPLPHMWVPALFFSTYLPLFALGYLGSLVVCSLSSAIYLQYFKSRSINQDPNNSLSNALTLNQSNKAIFNDKKFNPLFKQFCRQQRTTSDIYPLNSNSSNQKIKELCRISVRSNCR